MFISRFKVTFIPLRARVNGVLPVSARNTFVLYRVDVTDVDLTMELDDACEYLVYSRYYVQRCIISVITVSRPDPPDPRVYMVPREWRFRTTWVIALWALLKSPCGGVSERGAQRGGRIRDCKIHRIRAEIIGICNLR